MIDKVYVIPIRGEVNPSWYEHESVRSAIDEPL